MKLKVMGCRVDASASGEGMPEVKAASLYDPDCFRSGVIGLRSNGTGGIWRNVVVTPAWMCVWHERLAVFMVGADSGTLR